MTLPPGWSPAELERASRLAREARALTGLGSPWIAVRAPGRVNLIGEHTDYSALPVLPIAIDRSTILMAAPRPTSEIELHNSDPAYPPRKYALAAKIAPYAPGDWGNYHKAAVQGVIDHFASRGRPIEAFGGAAMFVDSDVPVAAGLSSSAALTVASALAFMAANRLKLPALEAAAMVARSEWYVGTMAGGMDQAVSLLAQPDHALLIEFQPLRSRPIGLPSELGLVVAQSLQPADKSGKVRDEYNHRVVECALAARILARVLKVDGVKILGDVVRLAPDLRVEDLLKLLREAAPARIENLAEAARILECEEHQLGKELLADGAPRTALTDPRPLEILRRVRHVLSEADRVRLAADALRSGRLEEMGALMNASHASLDQDFAVSTAALNALVEAAIRGGALGARLTGAGFGGSIVALCHRGDCDAVISRLDRDYYSKLGGSIEPQRARAVFTAGAGASAIELAAA